MPRNVAVTMMMESKTKDAAEKLCASYGVTLADAVNTLLARCIEERSLPFEADSEGKSPAERFDVTALKIPIAYPSPDGRIVLPAEEYLEQDDVYDEL